MPSTPRLTRRQHAVISAHTGVLCGNFEAVHEYIQELLERPVWTHELASEDMNKRIKKLSREEFMSICYDGNDERTLLTEELMKNLHCGFCHRKIKGFGSHSGADTNYEIVYLCHSADRDCYNRFTAGERRSHG